MTLRRRRLHRLVFLAAGSYNLAWGSWTVVNPGWLFRTAGMPPSPASQVFAGLGMVVGLYGILYLEVARVPEQGWVAVAIGLSGKVLGPVGLVWFVVTHGWPVGTLLLSIPNDLIWWGPFALYLRDAWPAFRDDLRSARRPGG